MVVVNHHAVNFCRIDKPSLNQTPTELTSKYSHTFINKIKKRITHFVINNAIKTGDSSVM